MPNTLARAQLDTVRWFHHRVVWSNQYRAGQDAIEQLIGQMCWIMDTIAPMNIMMAHGLLNYRRSREDGADFIW
jgi:hypothetical protein